MTVYEIDAHFITVLILKTYAQGRSGLMYCLVNVEFNPPDVLLLL